MGTAAALPHVAAGPAPRPAPGPVAKGSAAGAGLAPPRPAPASPPAPGAIHKARNPQQKACGQGGCGTWPRAAWRGGGALSPSREGQEAARPSTGASPGSHRERKREAISAPRGPTPAWLLGRVGLARAPTLGIDDPARGGAEEEACNPVTWPVPGGPLPRRCHLTSHTRPAGRARFPSRTLPNRDVTRCPWLRPRAPPGSGLR